MMLTLAAATMTIGGVRGQDNTPQVPEVLGVVNDTLTLINDSVVVTGAVPDSIANDSIKPAAPRPPRTASPFDLDDRKQTPVLHYYDKHGEPLEEPVLFLATLDTVTKPKAKPNDPLFNGVTVGVNFGDALMAAFGNKYGSYDVHADVSLHNWFFPVIEAGIGYAHTTPGNRNFSYNVDPSFYMKVGLNYNFLYKSNPDYQLYAGVRAAFSNFGWSATGVTINSSYWQNQTSFNMEGMRSTAWWGEVLAGLKVRIVSHFSLGWSVRWHFPFHFSQSSPTGLPDGMSTAMGSKPWFVPGYGGSGSFTFTISAMWTIPGKSKPKPEDIPEEATDATAAGDNPRQ